MKGALLVIAVGCLAQNALAQAPSKMASDKDPGVEVATVKLSSPSETGELFTIRGRHVLTINTPAMDLVKFAFGLHPSQIVDAPEWLAKERFDIDAVPAAEGIPNSAQMWMMIRKILADRFHLRYEFVQKELPAFALVRAGKELRMKRSSREPDAPVDFYGSHGELTVNNATMNDFAVGLSRGMVGRPVVNETGLDGRYDFTLRWRTEDSVSSDPDAPPGLFTALEEQAGLALKPVHTAVQVMRIEHIERPSAN